MQRILNDPSRVTKEALEGIILGHSDLLAKTENPRVVRYVGSPVKGRVGIVTGGGSGHEPAFVGYVGKNMVDVVAVGEILPPPRPTFFAMRSVRPTAELGWRFSMETTPGTT